MLRADGIGIPDTTASAVLCSAEGCATCGRCGIKRLTPFCGLSPSGRGRVFPNTERVSEAVTMNIKLSRFMATPIVPAQSNK